MIPQEKALRHALSTRQRIATTKEHVDRCLKLLQDRLDSGEKDRRTLGRQFSDALEGFGAEYILTTPEIGGVLCALKDYDIDLPPELPIGPKIEAKIGQGKGSYYDHKLIFEYWKPSGMRSVEDIVNDDGPYALVGYVLEYDYMRTVRWTGTKLETVRWLDHER